MASRFLMAVLGVLFSLNAAGQAQLVIGDNATTLVQKICTMDVAAGVSELGFEQLPPQTVLESITLSEPAGVAPVKILAQQLVFKDKAGDTVEDVRFTCSVESPAAGQRTFTLSYLVRGQGWQADYNAFLAPDRKSVTLQGWISLSNQTASQYPNPKITLARSMPDATAQCMPDMVSSSPYMRTPAGAGFIDGSLVPLEGVTLLNRYSTVCVPSINTAQIPIVPFLESETSGRGYREEYMPPESMPAAANAPSAWWWIEVDNTPENGMGKRIPKGSLRMFQQLDQGMTLINTGMLDTAPPGQKMRIRMAPEPGITVKKRVKQPGDGMRQDGGGSRNVIQSISLTSTLDGPREVRVFDRPENARRNAAISDASDLYKTLDDGRLEFRVEVTPGTERIITYTVAM